MGKLKLFWMLGSVCTVLSCWEDFANEKEQTADKGNNQQQTTSSVTIQDGDLIHKVLTGDYLKQFFENPPSTEDLSFGDVWLDINLGGVWCSLTVFYRLLKELDSFLPEEEQLSKKITAGNLKHLLQQNVDGQDWDRNNLTISTGIISENNNFRLRQSVPRDLRNGEGKDAFLNVLNTWVQLFYGKTDVHLQHYEEFRTEGTSEVVRSNFPIAGVEQDDFVKALKIRLGISENTQQQNDSTEVEGANTTENVEQSDNSDVAREDPSPRDETVEESAGDRLRETAMEGYIDTVSELVGRGGRL